MTISSIIKLIVAKDFSALDEQGVGCLPFDSSEFVSYFSHNIRVQEGKYDLKFYIGDTTETILKYKIPYYISKLGSLL